jgi:hypothetical protein
LMGCMCDGRCDDGQRATTGCMVSGMSEIDNSKVM